MAFQLGSILAASRLALAAIAALAVASGAAASGGLTPTQALGKSLFFDETLSHGNNQSCASCHSPSAAFADPDRSSPTSDGSNPALFGKRNAPSAMYMAFSPDFHFDADEGLYLGGQFYDGRAATLEAQAREPFTGKLEMGNASPAAVIAKLAAGPNAAAFTAVYGSNAFADTDTAFTNLAAAIAAYERSKELSPFTAKFDYYLDGKARLTAQEARGFAAFADPMKGNCSACHISDKGADGSHPLFTDFSYDNIGIPKNFDSKFLTLGTEFNPDGEGFIDLGLGGVLDDPSLYGAFKVTTLRNVAVTGAYGHNGWFETLFATVDFYATRDTKPVCANPRASSVEAQFLGCWPAPEIPGTINVDELGNLPLSERDKADIVAFLGTLTDGFVPTTIPEPSTWAMMLIGFALVGRRLAAKRTYNIAA